MKLRMALLAVFLLLVVAGTAQALEVEGRYNLIAEYGTEGHFAGAIESELVVKFSDRFMALLVIGPEVRHQGFFWAYDVSLTWSLPRDELTVGVRWEGTSKRGYVVYSRPW